MRPARIETTASCAENLRRIEAAKRQWALENHKSDHTPVAAADLAPYLENNILPVCPTGAAYVLNSVGIPAACTAPVHASPK
jgi:hypothetical protein